MLNTNNINELDFQQIKQNLEYTPNQKCVYICSPLSANTTDEFIQNMQNAKKYVYYVSMTLRYRAIAPHASLPMLLNDNIPDERALALEIGLKMLDKCDELFVCSNRITSGMRGEIIYALQKGKSIRVFNDKIFEEIKAISKSAKLPAKIIFEKNNLLLSLLISQAVSDASKDNCKCPYRR